ncbi:MAG TPA: alkyl sulfatase dimerization domain-containing protein [Acidimicrobiales bacterium]|nr:alkyl sulfatase dimerization domain-containing protein [Acidimicrobiales bacterium]
MTQTDSESAQTLASRQRAEILLRNGRVDEVSDRVNLAIGFHLGSVIQVKTPEGAVVIDSTGGTANAAAARDALRQRSDQETRYLVYTHCHPDHCGGGEELTSERTEAVVAQSLLPQLWDRDMNCLWPWHRRVRSWQVGFPEEAGGGFPPAGKFLAPTVTFDETMELVVGDLTVQLEHTQGETRDHLMVWIPELKVLCPGDLWYRAFPNLSTPAIGPRPIQGWIRSLERFIELEPEYLVPSHTPAVVGREEVRKVLTDYRDAIAHVWDASTQAMNDGLSVHQAARAIRLPDRLASLPYLAEAYGTVAWGVRAVYDQLTGWYDGDPANLDPLPRNERDAELVGLAGVDAIVARAVQLNNDGEHQLALELLSVVLSAHPLDEAANRAQIDACRALVAASPSVNQRGFYTSGVRAAEARLQKAADQQA